MSAISLQAFRPTAEKVYHVDVHPTLPWIVSSDGHDNVVVWDWEHRQVLYEVNAGGVDERRLVDAQLQRIADGEEHAKTRSSAVGAEAIRGGGVKDVKFYDDDVRFWTGAIARAAVAESPTVTSAGLLVPPIGAAPSAVRGRRFLFVCCDNKAIVADLVTMRTKDIPKLLLDNRSPLCVEFLPRSSALGDGPFACFGGPDGAIRVLSLATWQISRKFTGGHKGAVHCLLPFMAGNGEMMLASGGADGTLVMWGADSQASAAKEVAPKITLPKAHDGGVVGISLARIHGAAPHLVTCGGDKAVAFWDTTMFREVRRMKHAIPKTVCHTIASWRHPRVPAVEVLACAKDSHVWALEASGGSRPICDLSTHAPPTPQLAAGKKLKIYCMMPHSLQPHLVVCGTNVGVMLICFDRTAVPPAAALPTPQGSRQHQVAFCLGRGLNALAFQLLTAGQVGPGAGVTVAGGGGSGSQRPVTPAGVTRVDALEAAVPEVKQERRRAVPVAHESYSHLSVSKSGKYLAVLWPEVPFYSVYSTEDWGVVDSGTARHFAWDTCQDRFAILGGAVVPKVQSSSASSGRHGFRGRSKKDAKEAEAAAAAAMAAAAAALAGATVEVRQIRKDGKVQIMCTSIESGRREQVIGLFPGALLGVAYRMPKKTSLPGLEDIQANQRHALKTALDCMGPCSGILHLCLPLALNHRLPSLPFQLPFLSWETFKPISGMLPELHWSAWDPVVEYHTFASLFPSRPQPSTPFSPLPTSPSQLGDVQAGQRHATRTALDRVGPHSRVLRLCLRHAHRGRYPPPAIPLPGSRGRAGGNGRNLAPASALSGYPHLCRFRCLGHVAGRGATGGTWHHRQLFLATPTSVEILKSRTNATQIVVATMPPQFRCLAHLAVRGAMGGHVAPSMLPSPFFSSLPSAPSPSRCVFVDAGVSAIDLETRRRKEERKRREEEAKVVAEKGELALLAMAPPKTEEAPERVQLRPPMLQGELALLAMAPPKTEEAPERVQLRPPMLQVSGGALRCNPVQHVTVGCFFSCEPGKGELALLAMAPPRTDEAPERVQLRPPMLQVVRLASFSSPPAVPPISAMARACSLSADATSAPPGTSSGPGLLDGPEVKPPEVVVGGGGVPVAAGRLPMEQRRPVGQVYVVGVRDGVLWLVDRYMTAHAISLSHPGVRCRCLAAHGDPVGAVKWASRLGREHHDDLAQFMVGMGYAREALHLPGLSKRGALHLPGLSKRYGIDYSMVHACMYAGGWLTQFMVGMGYARVALHLPGLSKRFEYELALSCRELNRALHCRPVYPSGLPGPCSCCYCFFPPPSPSDSNTSCTVMWRVELDHALHCPPHVPPRGSLAPAHAATASFPLPPPSDSNTSWHCHVAS
ncbi:unnamed protein product [Closterium sp. NIES-65]|nr:unnamed protein product [Closterium sp. NIES-65]